MTQGHGNRVLSSAFRCCFGAESVLDPNTHFLASAACDSEGSKSGLESEGQTAIVQAPLQDQIHPSQLQPFDTTTNQASESGPESG